MTAASAEHERRASVLDALAVLAGLPVEPTIWPDGTRPDVLRADVSGRSLFVGEAKHTETPGRIDTAARLARYLQWVAEARPDRVYIAVCFGRPHDGRDWIHLIERVTVAAGVVLAGVAWRTLDPTHHVVVVAAASAARRTHRLPSPGVTSLGPPQRREHAPPFESRSGPGSPRCGLRRAGASTISRTRESGRCASAAG